jgi:hypothetical protein
MAGSPESIEIEVWWKPGGGMMYRRDCLPPTHEQHIYNYIKREFGVNPEDYGIPNPHPIKTVCPRCGCVMVTNDEKDEDLASYYLYHG